MFDFLRKERIVAHEGFNRWRVPPASIAIHLCIGSVYAWSIFNPPLTRIYGVVSSSSRDWSLEQVVWIFTIAIVFLGLSAAVAGKWLERVGPRMVGCVAACCWGGGFLIGGLGIMLHQLWLLYLGYGVIGGCGQGLGYVSPVSTLIRWFPDRRGMATGMAIMGFGGGAMIGAPLKEWLVGMFASMPTDLGPASGLHLITRDGIQLVDVAGVLHEVVIGKISGIEHAFVAGTGSTGVAATFFTLGIAYFVIMVLAALAYRVPRRGWKPAGWNPESAVQSGKMISANHVHIDQALKTPQFYLLWIVLCFNVTAGIGVLSVAKTMMGEIFGGGLPGIVTANFAATYVLAISIFNMVGRFGWASCSDRLGRKLTYWIFFVVGTLLYLSIPLCARRFAVSPSVSLLIYFYAATMLIFTMYGGGFATIPAYLADIFGTRFVGGIHGRLLTAWSTAGVLGPLAITWLRERAVAGAIRNLAAKADPAAFEAKFGAGLDQLAVLVQKKTVTIAKLMEIAPAGTINPSATLYNSTMYLMAGILVIALIANALVRPVGEEHHMEEEQPLASTGTRRECEHLATCDGRHGGSHPNDAWPCGLAKCDLTGSAG